MTLAELRCVLDRAVAEPNTAELPDVVGVLAAAQAAATARMMSPTTAPVSGGQLVDAGALAALLTVPVSQVYEQTRQRRIPCIRLGRYVRFDVVAVLAVLASAGTECPSLGTRKKRSNGAAKSAPATTVLPTAAGEGARH